MLSSLSHGLSGKGLAPRARGASALAPAPRLALPGRPALACRAAGAGDYYDPSSSQGGGGGGDLVEGPLDARPLFTLDRASAHDNLTFEDIRDAYEMCSTIPDSHERGQCYSVFNIDGDRMAKFYAPVSRLEDALLLGAAQGARRELEKRAAAAAHSNQQRQQQPQQQQQQHGREEDVNGPLAFLARLFLGH